MESCIARILIYALGAYTDYRAVFCCQKLEVNFAYEIWSLTDERRNCKSSEQNRVLFLRDRIFASQFHSIEFVSPELTSSTFVAIENGVVYPRHTCIFWALSTLRLGWKIVFHKVLKKNERRLMKWVPPTRSVRVRLMIKEPQPRRPTARVVFTVLTEKGPNAHGKVAAYQFLPTFCNTLRKNNFATAWAATTGQLARALETELPVVLVHLFGEDNVQIASPNMTKMERLALVTFNQSKTGVLLADKLASHRAFEAAQIPAPRLLETGGFLRQRFGSGLPTSVASDTDKHYLGSQKFIRTEFVDTRIQFKGRTYFTVVRLMCVDDVVLHAYTKARAENDGSASVHASHTPTNADFINYCHELLVRPRSTEFQQIATRLYHVLGPGFYAHDLLIDNNSGAVYVCESGFKFDSPVTSKRLGPIGHLIPSQAPLLPPENFSQRSAQAFLTRCRQALNGLKA